MRKSPDAPVKDTIRYPHVSDELLHYLDEQFPDRLPTRGTDLRELDHLIGMRHLIDHLAVLAQRQKDDDQLPHVL